MNKLIDRNYLEINSLSDLKESVYISNDYSVTLVDPCNFQLNKFFYKNIGRNHKWIDRLSWTETQWIDYVSNKNVKTFIFKNKEDLVGFFELIIHLEKQDIEIAYLGLS